MNIGIIGVGTVGQGVVNLLDIEKKVIENRIGEKVNILWLCDVRDIDDRDKEWKFTTNYKDIIGDDRIDTVLELMGGNTAAFDIAASVIESGKNLITANKHLLATRGEKLFTLAQKNKVKVFFEAAVAGGIPSVSTLYEGLFPGGIKSIKGILNGTANYILTKMEEGLSYDKALSLAQNEGYAEADPTFDIKGIDTGHKISLISYLTWGVLTDFDSIPIEGMDSITLEDIEKAKKEGKRIKLLGEAVKEKDGISIRVAPAMVSEDDLLYNTSGAYNAIETEGTHLGKTLLYGQGAGMYPTASAVISDLYKVANSKAWKV